MSSSFTEINLDDLYLMDSFVLKIDVDPEAIAILADFVVLPTSPLYTAPKPHESHCFKRAVMTFAKWDNMYWHRSDKRFAIDADGEIDYGGFDEFSSYNNHYVIRGTFGDMSFDSNVPKITLAKTAEVDTVA